MRTPMDWVDESVEWRPVRWSSRTALRLDGNRSRLETSSENAELLWATLHGAPLQNPACRARRRRQCVSKPRRSRRAFVKESRSRWLIVDACDVPPKESRGASFAGARAMKHSLVIRDACARTTPTLRTLSEQASRGSRLVESRTEACVAEAPSAAGVPDQPRVVQTNPRTARIGAPARK
jgi:hypothetical protein